MKRIILLFAVVVSFEEAFAVEYYDTIPPLAFVLPFEGREALLYDALNITAFIEKGVSSSSRPLLLVSVPVSNEVIKKKSTLNSMTWALGSIIYDFLLCDSLQTYQLIRFSVFVPNSKDSFKIDIAFRDDPNRALALYKYNCESMGAEEKAKMLEDASMGAWRCIVDRINQQITVECKIPGVATDDFDLIGQKSYSCAKFIYAYVLRNERYCFREIKFQLPAGKYQSVNIMPYSISDRTLSLIYPY